MRVEAIVEVEKWSIPDGNGAPGDPSVGVHAVFYNDIRMAPDQRCGR